MDGLEKKGKRETKRGNQSNTTTVSLEAAFSTAARVGCRCMVSWATYWIGGDRSKTAVSAPQEPMSKIVML